MWVAMWTVLGAIGLSIALPFLSGVIGGDTAETGFYVGVLIGIPAFLLLLPVLILAVVVDRAALRAYPVMPIVASWDVRLDEMVHAVSLPESFPSPDHVWVDGVRIPLAWTPTGVSTARAALDGGTFTGTLSWGYNAVELASTVLGGFPRPRYTLEVKGATVVAIPVTNGERRS